MRIPVFILTAARRARGLLPLAAIVLPIALVALVATRLGDFPAVRAAIESMRGVAGEWWAMPLFVLAYVAGSVFLLPLGLLSAAAALMWGWKVGALVELASVILACLPPFLLARRGLAGWVERRIPREDLPLLDSAFALFLMRLVPVVPFVALNYIAGATRIRVRDYVVVTASGSIPSIVLFLYFIDTMAGGAMGAATQAKIVGACVALGAAAIAFRWTSRRITAARSRANTAPPPEGGDRHFEAPAPPPE